MSENAVLSQPRAKFKSFRYQTELEWVGGRASMVRSDGKPSFRVASPPEFNGEAGVWTPEDLLVAAVETCTMTTFVSFAERRNLAIVSYVSCAEGLMENVEGSFQFTKIILKPTIVISDPADLDSVRQTLDDSHKKCFIANSIRAEILLEPKIVPLTPEK